LSLDKPRIIKRKIKNVKARRDIKRCRARKIERNKRIPISNVETLATFRRLIINITSLGKDRQEYILRHRELVGRTTAKVKVSPGGELGSPQRICEYSCALKQVLLHRVLFLYEGAFQALSNRNVYVMALSIRALYETTAAIGYLHSRISSYKNDYISAEELDKSIIAQLIGSKDKQDLSQEADDSVEAKHVMAMLVHADKVVSSEVLGGTKKEHTILTDIYEWLCEFCHPNFHSASISSSLDKGNEEYVFKYGQVNLVEREVNIIKNISIPALLFIDIFDRIEG